MKITPHINNFKQQAHRQTHTNLHAHTYISMFVCTYIRLKVPILLGYRCNVSHSLAKRFKRTKASKKHQTNKKKKKRKIIHIKKNKLTAM